MISEQQEANLAEAHARSKKKQDKTHPHVINIDDGRLMPNTPRLRILPNYRVYGGDINAALPERMKWLKSALRAHPKAIVNSKAEEDTFDVGTASVDDLIVFAVENFGASLNPKHPLKNLRAEVMRLAEVAEKQTEESLS
jgi:hypothetical protein